MLEQSVLISEQRGYYCPGTIYKWLRELADEYFGRGELSKAEELYLRTLPESHDLLQGVEVEGALAMISALLGKHDEAERYFQGCLTEDTKIRDAIEASYKKFLTMKKLPEVAN